MEQLSEQQVRILDTGEKEATRVGYGQGLVEIGMNKNVVVLDADLACSTQSGMFQKIYPSRFFNMGISEADMIGTAAGFASAGKIPFASSFAAFATGLTYNQIRQSICYSNLNVKIAGSHAGIATGEDGATHQALEDLSLMRGLPNMTVIQPADATEAFLTVKALEHHRGPAYVRLVRSKTPILFSKDHPFIIGKGMVLKLGQDVTLIGTGALVHICLKAAKILEDKGVSARVINIHTIKPIDAELIIRAAKETGAIVTAEDHSVIGGLGTAVSEVLIESFPIKIKKVGMNDEFGESGTTEDLYQKYNFTPEHIAKTAMELIK